jgi:hypothetical protein
MTNGKLIIGSVLFTLALGCQTPAEKQGEARVEARKEINEATVEASKKIDEAGKDLKEAGKEFGKEVADANKEVAEEVAEANKEMAEADKDAAKALEGDRYARFEIIKNETEGEFAIRAEAALARAQTDLDAAKLKAKSVTNETLAKKIDVASTAVAEAKKDLAELRTKTGKVFDDGRLGVGTAINRAQRNLSDAYQEMAALRM